MPLRTPEQMEQNLITKVTKQCGNCRWWDEIKSDHPLLQNEGICMHPIPESFKGVIKVGMHGTYGQDCPVYEERKI